MEDLIVHALANVGVPAAIAFYVLFKVNSTLAELVTSIKELTLKIETRL